MMLITMTEQKNISGLYVQHQYFCVCEHPVVTPLQLYVNSVYKSIKVTT